MPPNFNTLSLHLAMTSSDFQEFWNIDICALVFRDENPPAAFKNQVRKGSRI
jgi:hypothetical protein